VWGGSLISGTAGHAALRLDVLESLGLCYHCDLSVCAWMFAAMLRHAASHGPQAP
jgi:hypothetical protein